MHRNWHINELRRSGVLVLLRRFSAPSALTSSHGFSGLLNSAYVTQLAHHLVNVLPLRALSVFGELVGFLDSTFTLYKTCMIR